MQKMNDNSQNESIDSIDPLDDLLFDAHLALADEPEVTISKSAVDAAIDRLDKSDNTLKNIKTTLNKLIKDGFIDVNRFEAQFATGEFGQLQTNLKNHVRAGNGQSNWNSHLNSIKTAVLSLVNGIDISGMTFKESLHAICDFHKPEAESGNQKANFLVQRYEISPLTVRKWLFGRTAPRSDASIDFVQHLDDRFNLNEKLLEKVKGKAVTRTKLKAPSRYDFELSVPFQEEINTYSEYKIHGINRTKNSLFNKLERDERREYVQKVVRWTQDANGQCRSKDSFIANVKFFVNYLVKTWKEANKSKLDKLSEEDAVQELQNMLDQITLVDLFDYDNLAGLGDFVIVQKYGHTAANSFLAWVVSECHKDSYVALTLEPPKDFKTLDKWVKELRAVKTKAKEIRRKLMLDKEVLEGDRNVSWIIEQDNPRQVVNDISDELRRLAEIKISRLNGDSVPEKTYTSLRHSMSFDFLAEIPVRKKNLIEADWLGVIDKNEIVYRIKHENNLCGIYQREETGDYWYFCAKPLLKNRKSKTVTNIHYCLSNLNDQIKSYLEIRERFLVTKGKSCRRFLLNAKGNELSNRDMLFQSETLNVIHHLYPEIKQYIATGINPHGMRHLMATLFLKENPEQYGALATLLMDDLSTVLSTYAKRDDKGNFEKIREYNAKRRGGQL